MRRAWAVVAVLTAQLAFGVSAEATDWRTDDCRSERETDEAGHVVYKHTGTPDHDVCFGTGYVDIFWVRGDRDRVLGYGRADHIHLGAGDDLVDAGGGDDWIYGGAGTDEIHGNGGDDRAFDGNDEYVDGDTIYGESGSDWADMQDDGPDDFFFAGRGEDRDPKYDYYMSGGSDCVDKEPPNDCRH